MGPSSANDESIAVNVKYEWRSPPAFTLRKYGCEPAHAGFSYLTQSARIPGFNAGGQQYAAVFRDAVAAVIVAVFLLAFGQPGRGVAGPVGGQPQGGGDGEQAFNSKLGHGVGSLNPA